MRWIAFGIALCVCSTATAQLYVTEQPEVEELQREALEDLRKASLEDLLNAVITVSSKKVERASDAPGVVTVYQQDEIRRLGYYTVADLASITSGYSASRRPSADILLESTLR